MIYGHRIPSVVQEVREVVAQELFDQIGLVAKEINIGVVSGSSSPPAPRLAACSSSSLK